MTAAPTVRRAGPGAWLRALVLAAVVIAAGWYLADRWPQVWHTLHSLSIVDIGLSQLAVCAAMLTATYGWRAVVGGAGTHVNAVRAGQIYLVGQLGKYLPGSVWAYLLQMELGRRAGVPRSRVCTASLVQVGASLVAAMALGVLAFPVRWLPILLPVGVILLHPAVLTRLTSCALRVLRRPPLERPLDWATVARVTLAAVATYLLYGVHLWLLAGSNVLLCSGAMAIGLNAGLLVFFLPSGAGLREVVVAAVLAPVVGPVQAAAFALVSRVLCTVGDLVMAGAAAGLARWREPLTPPGQ